MIRHTAALVVSRLFLVALLVQRLEHLVRIGRLLQRFGRFIAAVPHHRQVGDLLGRIGALCAQWKLGSRLRGNDSGVRRDDERLRCAAVRLGSAGLRQRGGHPLHHLVERDAALLKKQ